MSRFLLTWELGTNLGHLARLLPIARELKARGHSVVAAVREVPAAAMVLGPSGIPFVQAPQLPHGLPLLKRPSEYADILSQGWSNPEVLWGLTQSWHNLMRMVRPDAVVQDHSPTAALAARLAGIRSVMIGDGAELPPVANPLPPFPGFSWATAEKDATSERLAVDNASIILKRPPLTNLSALFCEVTRPFVTVPELDHYGARADADYVAPLLGAPPTETMDCPSGKRRILACLRPDTNEVDAILGALPTSEAAMICVREGFCGISIAQIRPYRHDIRDAPSRPHRPDLAGGSLCLILNGGHDDDIPSR